MKTDKRFWLGISLLNLSGVALLGFLLRSKIIFSLPFIDYRNLLSAHANLAISGWLGLALTSLLIFQVLPPHLAKKKIYTCILWSLHWAAAGMGVSFLFLGFHPVSVFFLLLSVLVCFVFGWTYIRHVLQTELPPLIRRIAVGAAAALVLGAIGPVLLSFILLTGWGNSLLYRDISYTYIHLQYSGFFTLALFASFFAWWQQKKGTLPATAGRFSHYLLLSVIPSAFTALLWHNRLLFYLLAAVGCLFILIAVLYFIPIFRQSLQEKLFHHPLTNFMWIASALSFVLKMVLTTGTLYPSLGNAVYGTRPIIIGFLHLAFLGFVSFYVLGYSVEESLFSQRQKPHTFPFWLFGLGIVCNEVFLMLQGLAFLLQASYPIYNWLLWGSALLLLSGALLLAGQYYHRRI